MKNKTRRACRTVAAALSLLLALTPLAACGSREQAPQHTTLTAAYSELGKRLNPFYVTTDCEEALMGLTQVRLLTLDRVGDVVRQGIAGETRSYAGMEDTYRGICDLSVLVDEETGGATYTVTLREGLTFSDGTPLTADDVIFSFYVLCDPAYDGNAGVRYAPITGLGSYLTQTDSERYAALGAVFDAIRAAGAGHLWNEGDGWSQDEQGTYDDCVAAAWQADLAAVTDYCVSSFAAACGGELLGIPGEAVIADESLHVAFAMAAWGFAALDADGVYTTALGSTYTLAGGDAPTLADFYNETYTIYEGDPDAYWDDVNGGEIDQSDVFLDARNAYISALGGGGVADIAGIARTDARTVTVTTDSYDAGDIYKIFDLYVAPFHYYGDPALYDPAAGSFGFVRGDLSCVAARDGAPLGAGSYTFVSADEGSITLAANDLCWLGAPATPNIRLCRTDENPAAAVADGTADIASFEGTADAIEQSRRENTGGELSGDVLLTRAADLNAYGYIGINANTVSVGGDPSSAASLALRRAFATLFAVYREAAVSGYYGGAARVINYPISETSYIAPAATDSDYRVAFSTAPDGSAIYSADMSTEGRYAAALAAARGYFVAAGYTYDATTGRFTSPPEGGSMEFEAIVPGDGTGDHACYGILKKAAEALGTLGITLKLVDPVSTSLLWDRLRAGTQQIWCAARTTDPEPDLRDAYATAATPAAGGTNYSGIADEVLDYYITSARLSGDRTFRRISYRQCLDIILDWAVELPVYQRQRFTLLSAARLDPATVPATLTVCYPWYAVAGSLGMQ